MHIDTLVIGYFIAGTIANIAMFIVQAVKLYRIKDSTGLSFVTFFGFNLIQLSTVFYGVLRHDLLLTYGYILTLIAAATVTLMIPCYRKKCRESM